MKYMYRRKYERLGYKCSTLVGRRKYSTFTVFPPGITSIITNELCIFRASSIKLSGKSYNWTTYTKSEIL